MTDKELFIEVVVYFAGKYPHRNICIKKESYGNILNVDGVERFNIDGYSLLFNLKRITEILSDELR